MSYAIHDTLLQSAKSFRRRPQDHLIKCLAESLADSLVFEVIPPSELLGLPGQDNLNELRKFAQIIPSEMLDALNQQATEKQISLECEAVSRLHAILAALAASEASSLNLNSQQIRRRKFNFKEAVAECARKRLGNLYLYEMDKLRHYLRFKSKLPRGFKEEFKGIDVVAATQEILAEFAAEAALFKHTND